MKNNSKYSELTEKIIKLSEKVEMPNRAFRNDFYDQQIEKLDEYLKYNTSGFEEFNVLCQNIPVSVAGININVPMHIFCSIGGKSDHILWINGDMSEINYTLKNPVNVKNVIKNNSDVSYFSIRLGHTMSFKKKYANKNYFWKEEYIPGERVRVDLIDTSRILNEYYDDNYFESNKLKPESAFKYEPCWSSYHRYERLFFEEIGPNIYQVDRRDCDGRPLLTEIIEGESLYSAYHNYMRQKGYLNTPGDDIINPSIKFKENHLIINEEDLDFVDIQEFSRKVRALLIDDNNNVLVGNYNGVILFPGGKIDYNENINEAIRRELNEEIGVDYDSSELEYLSTIDHYQKDYPKMDGTLKNRLVVTRFYVGKYKGIGKQSLSEREKANNFKLELVPIDELIDLVLSSHIYNPRNTYFYVELATILDYYKNTHSKGNVKKLR